jgi:hypothetical protein
MTLLGAAWCAVAARWLHGLRRASGPLRVGPWPGLSARGGLLLLACSLLLGGSQALLGLAAVDVGARAALPYMPVMALLSLGAVLVAVWSLPVPGVASGVCGAYLAAASLVSLLLPAVAPPPMLLPAATALDLALWLRPSDFRALGDAWPRRDPRAALRRAWRPRGGRPREVGRRRALAGGAVFGLLVAWLEPPYDRLLGSPAAQWPTEHLALAAAVAGTLGAALGWAVAVIAGPAREVRG